jgi:deoxyuridine 5'-triphosphate nucleotidohydrolase
MPKKMTLKVKRLTKTAKLPTKAYEHDAGFDLYADESTTVSGITIVSTGIAVEIPPGYSGVIKDRSGIATKRWIHIVAGVIDSQYRGEVKVAMSGPVMTIIDSIGNCIEAHSSNKSIKYGDKIAQLLILPVPNFTIEEVDNLSDTERSDGGFGSTGN